MTTGTVAWFNPTKDFGFIGRKNDDGRSLYIYPRLSALACQNYVNARRSASTSSAGKIVSLQKKSCLQRLSVWPAIPTFD